MTRTRLALTIGTAMVAAAATAGVASAGGRIGRREGVQQGRIARGIAGGQFTAREAVRLERREVGLHREVGAMRRANGGVLTPAERGLVNRQQNRLSHGIWRLKHNDRRR